MKLVCDGFDAPAFDSLPSPARDVFKSKAEGGRDLVKLALDLSMEIGNFEDFLPLP